MSRYFNCLAFEILLPRLTFPSSRSFRKSNIDVLIATHSPDIIHDRWDLTVELKGPGE